MRALALAVLLVQSGSARAQEAPAAPAEMPAQPSEAAYPAPSGSKNAAWLLVGGALTFATAGAVLAYSTTSAEQDIKDLYAGTTGRAPDYDAGTRRRYEELVDEGNRYQTLSYIAFGLTAACAGGAAYFFWRASQESPAEPKIAPVITPTGAAVRFTF